MQVRTKHNIGDEVWYLYRGSPRKSRVGGVKFVAKEMSVLGKKGQIEAQIATKIRYLLDGKWRDDSVVAKEKGNLWDIKPSEVLPKPQKTQTAEAKIYTSVEDLPL